MATLKQQDEKMTIEKYSKLYPIRQSVILLRPNTARTAIIESKGRISSKIWNMRGIGFVVMLAGFPGAYPIENIRRV